MRQLIYVSTAATGVTMAETDAILTVSRRNNTRDGITGLLFFDGKRFLQAIEGEAAAIATTLARIEGDRRHRALVVLSDRSVDVREFGEWAMAHRRPGGDQDAALLQVSELVRQASPSVRATFEGFAGLRRAA